MKHYSYLIVVLLAINVVSLIFHKDIKTPVIKKASIIPEKEDLSDSVYSIYFYLDAALILPESRPVIEKVMTSLEEHPDSKIYIQGYTSRKAAGPMIIKGESADYFDLNDKTNDMSYGSATDLSKARAEIVKDYLVNEGIPKERIHVMRWLSDKPKPDSNDIAMNKWANACAQIEFAYR